MNVFAGWWKSELLRKSVIMLVFAAGACCCRFGGVIWPAAVNGFGVDFADMLELERAML